MAEESRRAPIILLAGAVAVLLLIGGIYLVGRWAPSSAPAVVKALPMGPKEQAYAQQIHFLDPHVSRAANFLNQEVTYIFGTVENDGPRTINQIQVTLEFHDIFGQVVLRDSQRLFPELAGPLAPGQKFDFQLSYEHVPEQWNMQYPTVTVSGLDLK